MDQFRIEIQNVSQTLVMLTCPAKAPLLLNAADRGREPQRVALTSEQFLCMAYDLEGFVDGTHGVTQKLALWVTELASNREERVPFEIGRMVATGGFSADAEAVELQSKQEADIDAKRAAVLAAKAAADPSTLAGSVQAGINSLT